MKGDHIDDSEWERLVLPLENSFADKSNTNRRHSSNGSPVKTYIDVKEMCRTHSLKNL